MPRAHIGDVARWLQDHDSDVVDESPPILNTWYEVFHAEDVRLLRCVILQSNVETAAKDIEVRWTIDGTVYFTTVAAANGTEYGIIRHWYPSVGGTGGLAQQTSDKLAVATTDKRGLDFEVEVRIVTALGTTQRLVCWCVRETQEIT